MDSYTSDITRLKAAGVSFTIAPGGFRAFPADKIPDEVRRIIGENRDHLVRDLWLANNVQILGKLPRTASGPAMSAEKCRAFREYLTKECTARLIDYRGIGGTVIRATPPTEECPAGTIAMLTDEGTKADYDARALRYPDGRPVANAAWVEVEPCASGIEF